MKALELRERTLEELRQMARDKREDIFKLKFQQSIGQVRNAALLRAAKRDLARIETVIREQELGLRSVAGSGSPQAEKKQG
jgi:large subunit ribosomal protein L29